MRCLLHCLFCLLSCIGATSLSARTLVISNDKQSYDLSSYLQYSIDTACNKGIDGIKCDSTIWQTFENGAIPNMGVKREPYWFTFTLQNNSDKDDWILYVDYRTLDEVSVFVYDTAGVLLSSDKQGILTKNIQKQRVPLFPMILNKNASIKVYLRVQTSSLLIVPIRISTPLAFCEAENEQRNMYLPAWGILLAALLFNLVLLISSKEKGFLFLLFSIGAEICFIAVVTGLFYETVTFDHPIILQKLRFIFAGLTYGFHALFTVHYLNLKNYKRIWQVEIASISAFFLYSLLAGSGLITPHIAGVLLVPANIIFFLVQFAVAAFLSWKKAPMARYYLFSFLPVFLAMLLYIAVFESWINPNLFFSNSGLYASALFAVFLTSGLTEKMIKVKHEKDRADHLEIDNLALEKEITQRKVVEENLLESQMRFHSLFELSPLPVLLTEYESGRIVDANFAVFDYTGFQERDFIGNTTYEMGFIHVTKREELFNQIQETGKIEAYETILPIKGTPRTVHLFMSLLNLGKSTFIITLISDITQQKEAEKKLKELNLTKDKFLSIIAHDLVNPFHAMILYSKELRTFTAGNERAASYNANLLLTAQNTYNLLQNLLMWTRTQTNLISFNPQATNLGDLIAENVSNGISIAKSKQIEIINEASSEILIEADLQMINLILRNLISNSIKFSFNQGVVTIRSHEDDNSITISVIDQGTGMEPQEITKLFNEYETAQRPGTAGESGTGLGLIICREFVNYHKGVITVESEPGNGCTFKVTLPKKQKLTL
ncbi:MAG: ATP-binding protein [Mariniphaga sp.]